jgi:hypothetical protein
MIEVKKQAASASHSFQREQQPVGGGSPVSISLRPQLKDTKTGFESVENRNAILKNIPSFHVRQAWHASSHLLLPEHATLLKTGCREGYMSAALALINPDLNIIGIDQNPHAIERANQAINLHNLSFKVGSFTDQEFLKNNFQPQSLDAIVNSYILYQIYSEHKFDTKKISETLKAQFDLLKVGGLMYIQDYSMPPPDIFVLLELQDQQGGDDFLTMSDAQLLEWFSENARPWQDAGCHGFYLEKMPSRLPKTSLYRLPYKWAYEFILRKDKRAVWEEELYKEYTFYARHDYRRELRNIGARVMYSAAHWDDAVIKRKFTGNLKLYSDDGYPLELAPTSYILVAQKVDEGSTLRIQERRPFPMEEGKERYLKISSAKHKTDGRIFDVISRHAFPVDYIPYRLSQTGRLKVFLRDEVQRPVTNAVPRKGKNLDIRRWSGYMIEPVSFDLRDVQTVNIINHNDVAAFIKDKIGLKVATGCVIENGAGYYPDPKHIDEYIQTQYIRIDALSETENAIYGLREFDAQTILNAISVGYIPNSRLELQILYLFRHLGIKYESWDSMPMELQTQPDDAMPIEDLESLMDQYQNDQSEKNHKTDYHFQKSTQGQFRHIQSAFVQEGLVEGVLRGVSSHNHEFVVSNQHADNVAVVLPLVKKLSGEVMAGIVKDFHPIPQRYKGDGTMISCPKFNLPPHISSYEMARKYVADQFEVPIEYVSKMGESFFVHTGITPQRIYPFAVSAPAGTDAYKHGVTALAPLASLWKLFYCFDIAGLEFLKTIAIAYNQFCADSDLSVAWNFDKSFAAEQSDIRNIEILAPVDFSNYLNQPYDKPAPTSELEKKSKHYGFEKE